ncbi:MAG: hypothetical protein AAF594_08505 [Bacteroidota bacterium]
MSRDVTGPEAFRGGTVALSTHAPEAEGAAVEDHAARGPFAGLVTWSVSGLALDQHLSSRAIVLDEGGTVVASVQREPTVLWGRPPPRGRQRRVAQPTGRYRPGLSAGSARPCATRRS